MWSSKVTRIAAVVVAVTAAVAWEAPAGAAPKAKVPLLATVISGSSETVRYPDPGVGQVLFEQSNRLTVQGTFADKPLEGTLEYRLRVRVLSPGEPAQFLDATTQSATFTSNLGDLSSETSWYAVPVIGFECLTADAVQCMDHNAVTLNFGVGTGDFSSLRNNGLWTMRVARHSTEGVVTDGTLSGGSGLGFKYCYTGDVTTVASDGEGDYRTATALMLISAACYDENGDFIAKEIVPGGAMTMQYGYGWDVTLDQDEPVVSLYPDRSAAVWSDSGRMTGVVADIHMGAWPPDATGDALMMGGPWGDMSDLYASYKYALVRTYNLGIAGPDFPLGAVSVTEGSLATGIFVVY
jgi:hypothetical protein